MKAMYRDSDVFQLLSEQVNINHNSIQKPQSSIMGEKEKCILCIMKPDSAICQCQLQNNNRHSEHEQMMKSKLRSSIGNLQVYIITLEAQNNILLKKLQDARVDIGYLSIQGIKHARTIMELENKLQHKQKESNKLKQLEQRLQAEEKNASIIQQLKQQLQQQQKRFNQKIIFLQSKLPLNLQKPQQNPSQTQTQTQRNIKDLKDQLNQRQTKIDQLTKLIEQLKQQTERRIKQQKQNSQLEIQEMKLNIQTLKRAKSEQFIKQITSHRGSPQKYRNGIIMEQDMAGADILESLIRLQQQNYKQQPIEKSIERHLLNFVVDFQTANKTQKPKQLESALQIEKVRIKKYVKGFNVMTKQGQITSK